MPDPIEAYRTNAPMREAYYRMNGITHVAAWDSLDDYGYNPALCDESGNGFRMDAHCGTVGQVIEWARKYCPELPVDA